MKGLSEAETLLKQHEPELAHARQVAALAGQLFTSLQTWHQRDPRTAELLHLAALLHDIGWSQSPDGSGHHKLSARLILKHPWKELTPSEIQIVAQTARYHRKSVPSEKHRSYRALNTRDRQLVCELGGILRVADALDRSHTLRIDSVCAHITPQAIHLSVEARTTWIDERRAVLKKCDLLEITAQRKVRFCDSSLAS